MATTRNAPPKTLRTQLETEAADLRIEVGSFTIEAPTGADPLDISVATAARDERASFIRLHRERLDAIEAALVRLADGTWGQCSSCSKPIQKARLKALPMADQCIGCASQRR